MVETAAAKAHRPRPCKVCRLPEGEVRIVEGASRSFGARSVAARFNTLSRKDVARHMSRCVSQPEEKEVGEQ